MYMWCSSRVYLVLCHHTAMERRCYVAYGLKASFSECRTGKTQEKKKADTLY